MAKAFEEAAADLENALRAGDSQLLNLTQAAKQSGYSARYLGELVRRGTIPNAGKPKAPKIRGADLPRKASIAREPGGRNHGLITQEAVHSRTKGR